nr:molybdenum cofactor guanylyltransferase [Phorcysia thermohydrogeniphila]
MLAGGKSSRFGRDKLSEPVAGRLLVEWTLNSVKDFPEVIVVTKNPLKFPHLKGVRVIPEPFKDFSPIYGILTGLKRASYEKVLFLPGDTPFLSSKALRAFSGFIPPAVVSEGSRVHSLLCLLSKRHVPAVEEFLRSGRHRISELHRVLGSTQVDFKSLEPFDYTRKSLLNINRKEELNEAICRQAYRGC